MKRKTKDPAMMQMKKMAIGEYIEFPIERLSSIKNMACVVGTENGTRLSTRVDRDKRIVIVSRMY